MALSLNVQLQQHAPASITIGIEYTKSGKIVECATPDYELVDIIGKIPEVLELVVILVRSGLYMGAYSLIYNDTPTADSVFINTVKYAIESWYNTLNTECLWDGTIPDIANKLARYRIFYNRFMGASYATICNSIALALNACMNLTDILRIPVVHFCVRGAANQPPDAYDLRPVQIGTNNGSCTTPATVPINATSQTYYSNIATPQTSKYITYATVLAAVRKTDWLVYPNVLKILDVWLTTYTPAVDDNNITHGAIPNGIRRKRRLELLMLYAKHLMTHNITTPTPTPTPIQNEVHNSWYDHHRDPRSTAYKSTSPSANTENVMLPPIRTTIQYSVAKQAVSSIQHSVPIVEQKSVYTQIHYQPTPTPTPTPIPIPTPSTNPIQITASIPPPPPTEPTFVQNEEPIENYTPIVTTTDESIQLEPSPLSTHDLTNTEPIIPACPIIQQPIHVPSPPHPPSPSPAPIPEPVPQPVVAVAVVVTPTKVPIDEVFNTLKTTYQQVVRDHIQGTAWMVPCDPIDSYLVSVDAAIHKYTQESADLEVLARRVGRVVASIERHIAAIYTVIKSRADATRMHKCTNVLLVLCAKLCKQTVAMIKNSPQASFQTFKHHMTSLSRLAQSASMDIRSF